MMNNNTIKPGRVISYAIICSSQILGMAGGYLWTVITDYRPAISLTIALIPPLVTVIVSFILGLAMPIEMTFKRALLISLAGSLTYFGIWIVWPLFFPYFDVFFLANICYALLPILVISHLITSVSIWIGSIIRKGIISLVVKDSGNTV